MRWSASRVLLRLNINPWDLWREIWVSCSAAPQPYPPPSLSQLPCLCSRVTVWWFCRWHWLFQVSVVSWQLLCAKAAQQSWKNVLTWPNVHLSSCETFQSPFLSHWKALVLLCLCVWSLVWPFINMPNSACLSSPSLYLYSKPYPLLPVPFSTSWIWAYQI